MMSADAGIVVAQRFCRTEDEIIHLKIDGAAT